MEKFRSYKNNKKKKKKVKTGKINLGMNKPKPISPNTGKVKRKYKTTDLPSEPGKGLDDYSLDVMELN